MNEDTTIESVRDSKGRFIRGHSVDGWRDTLSVALLGKKQSEKTKLKRKRSNTHKLQCKECSVIVISSSPSRKYCDNCCEIRRRELQKLTSKKYYRNHKELHLLRTRRWDNSHKEKKCEINIKWQVKNPEKVRAHRIVNQNHLRGDKCERCKSPNKLHAHHNDYSKPKEIITLCVQCHVDEHKRLRGDSSVL